MSLPWSDRRQARLFVGDTGGLMNDVIATVRRGHLTSLPAALHHDSILLYIPRHVLIEIERDLPIYAKKPRNPVDPGVAIMVWQELYAPCIRVVDVPEAWGATDPRVEAIANRHSPDAPMARLVSALAECYVIARDGDVTDYFGQHEHLDLLLAAANAGELNYVNQMAAVPTVLVGAAVTGVVQGFRKLPAVAQVVALAGAGVVAYYWQQNGRAARHLKQVASVAGEFLQFVGPPLQQLYERQRASEEVWATHAVPQACPKSISEQVARVLAFAPDAGLLAREIADELELSGSLRARTAAVRSALEECEAFAEVSRYRWRLGHPVTDRQPNLAPELTVDWLRRAHRDVVPRPRRQLGAE